MLEMIREAGVFVYGVLLFGTLSLRWAVLFARTRDSADRAKFFTLVALAVAFGLIGSLVGMQVSVKYITTVPDKWLFLVGLRESLHNLTLALGFVIADLLSLLLVPARAARQPELAEKAASASR